MAVKFEKVAEIRRAFVSEQVNLPAMTKNGTSYPARQFLKEYYNAEMDGEAVLLRVRDNPSVSRDFKKGDIVVAVFEQVEVESDISQMYVRGLTLKGK